MSSYRRTAGVILVVSFVLLMVASLNCKWCYTFNIDLVEFSFGINERLKLFGVEIYETKMEVEDTILSERIKTVERIPPQHIAATHLWVKVFESTGDDSVFFENHALFKSFANDPCVAQQLTVEDHVKLAHTVSQLYQSGDINSVEDLLSTEMKDCFIY